MSLKSKIEKIILAIKDTNINEIEITNFWGAQKIKLKTKDFIEKNIIQDKPEIFKEKYENNNTQEVKDKTIDAIPEATSNNDNLLNNENLSDNKEYTIINAPLVGTFYHAAKPGDKPFVEIGTKINVGDPLCIIEAMKIFNTIESELEGEIKEILILDGEPVEYGQALFSIDIN